MHLALKGRLVPNPSFGGKNENVKKMSETMKCGRYQQL